MILMTYFYKFLIVLTLKNVLIYTLYTLKLFNLKVIYFRRTMYEYRMNS